MDWVGEDEGWRWRQIKSWRLGRYCLNLTVLEQDPDFKEKEQQKMSNTSVKSLKEIEKLRNQILGIEGFIGDGLSYRNMKLYNEKSEVKNEQEKTY